jgi:hypothetical protein
MMQINTMSGIWVNISFKHFCFGKERFLQVALNDTHTIGTAEW